MHVPYMTPQWRRAIRHRNRLWHKYRQNRNITNWTLYKKQRNLCTTLGRKAIVQYFQHKADGCSTKPKHFWNFFGSLFHSRKGLANDIVLRENDEFVTDKLTIANLFNDYFVNICEHIPVPGPDFTSHPSILTINNSMLGSSNSSNNSSGQFFFQTISASFPCLHPRPQDMTIFLFVLLRTVLPSFLPPYPICLILQLLHAPSPVAGNLVRSLQFFFL